MKFKLLSIALPVLFWMPFVHAQELLNITRQNSCSYYDEDIADDVYGFSSSEDAERIVQEIVEQVGLQKNFIIKAGNVPNAVATARNGKRMIVYSQDFMLRLKNQGGGKWAAYGILAHEIGHHLNGHTIEDGGSKPPLELEADQFAGFVLAKMGATLEQAQSAVNAKSSSSGSSTHPPRSARREAVAVGWNKAKEKMDVASRGGQNRISPPEQPLETDKPDPRDEELLRLKAENERLLKQKTEAARKADEEARRRIEAEQNRAPATTSVIIGYSGDQYYCSLPITINIGGMTFAPTNNYFTVTNIPTGSQNYSIAGTISCPSLGNCYAAGEGTILVRPGAVYWITWQANNYGGCDIWLLDQGN